MNTDKILRESWYPALAGFAGLSVGIDLLGLGLGNGRTRQRPNRTKNA